MSEEKAPENIRVLAGKSIRFTRPTDGQVQALIRIGFGLKRMDDSTPKDFWVKQLDRMGTLLESLIHEDDRDAVDQMYLTGQVDHTELIRAVMGTLEKEAEASEDKAIAKAKKSNPARVRRD
jgi:hypothetical protein